ncbi:diguanylate cyclase [Hydrogenophilus thermoluteolus]|nr:sensor domain-containing diguanylate cyclase [Hydrogenophilus thermoluteolus]MBW7657550.1 diguanylate cyclase [Hydrogenophilus thermoluteolus]HCO76939.1 hypothetical protein [Rhodocyclaceae bacterium]
MMEPSFERAFWALAAADLALWQLDFPTERAMLDERWAQWVGLPAQKGEGITLTFAAWRARVHPIDWPRVRKSLIALVKGTSDYYCERYRIRTERGGWCWLEDRGRITQRDEQTGRARIGIGVCRNVTDEMEQAAWKELLSEAVIRSPVATVICDAEDRIIWVNPAAEQLFARQAADLFGQFIHRFLETGAATTGEKRGALVAVHTQDGTTRWVERIVTPFTSSLSHERFSVYVLHDITERIALEQQLRQLALTDVLTGLPNRRAFMERAEALFARIVRSAFHERAAVALIDLDHFKRINDTFGHSAGDAVLRDFADLLRANFRTMDEVGRLGGEEFGVVMPLVVLHDRPTNAFERLLREVRLRRVTFSGHHIQYTCSIGVTEVGPSDRAFDDVLARADRALYQAKAEGRNRLIWLAADE